MDKQTREVLENVYKELQFIHAALLEIVVWQKREERLQKGLEDRAEHVVVLHPCDTEEPKGPAWKIQL